MKLYTEEQVKHTLQLMGLHIMINEFIKKAEPIELPTRNMADEASLTNSAESKIDFINGFIWTCSRIREQIN